VRIIALEIGALVAALGLAAIGAAALAVEASQLAGAGAAAAAAVLLVGERIDAQIDAANLRGRTGAGA